MNTTFCMAPWVNIGVNPNGEYNLCCVVNNSESPMGVDPYLEQREFTDIDREDNLYVGSLQDNTLEEIWNNDKMRDIRIKMLKGKPVGNCSACYYSESITGSSERTRYLSEYFHSSHRDKVLQTKPDRSAPFEPVSWDLRLTNTCNFKCRDCGSYLSSSWEEESRKLNVDVSSSRVDVPKVLDELEPIYDHAEEIYFAGGEPLISDHHYHILDRLLEKDLRPTLRYNTNLSTLTYKGKDIIEYWKQFPSIRLFVSFDGIGKRGELIRKGFDSKRFLKNILRIQKELPHLPIYYNFVVYILNAYHFMDAHEFMADNGILRSCDCIAFTLLTNPQYLRISTLDSESKEEVLEKIRSSKFKINYNDILKFLKKEDNSEYIPQFKFMSDSLDAVRNENTLETFPELHRLLK